MRMRINSLYDSFALSASSAVQHSRAAVVLPDPPGLYYSFLGGMRKGIAFPLSSLSGSLHPVLSFGEGSYRNDKGSARALRLETPQPCTAWELKAWRAGPWGRFRRRCDG